MAKLIKFVFKDICIKFHKHPVNTNYNVRLTRAKRFGSGWPLRFWHHCTKIKNGRFGESNKNLGGLTSRLPPKRPSGRRRRSNGRRSSVRRNAICREPSSVGAGGGSLDWILPPSVPLYIVVAAALERAPLASTRIPKNATPLPPPDRNRIVYMLTSVRTFILIYIRI